MNNDQKLLVDSATMDEAVKEKNLEQLREYKRNPNKLQQFFLKLYVKDLQTAGKNQEYNTPNTQMPSGQDRGRAKVLSDGHSYKENPMYENYNEQTRQSGFISLLIMALLSGFATGAIATAMYIFINLGKVTFTL